MGSQEFGTMRSLSKKLQRRNQKVEIMTPKEILKKLVTKMFNDVELGDLSRNEREAVDLLEFEGVVTVESQYRPIGHIKSRMYGDYKVVSVNEKYFEE